MLQVNTTEFRRHLFEYLKEIETKPLELVRHGQVVARVVPIENQQQIARKKLIALRKTAKIVDIETPVLSQWTYDDAHFNGYSRTSF